MNDRIISVNNTFGGVTTTLASNITYKPVGGIAGLTYGNGLGRAIGYDNQYRPTSISTGDLQNLTYGYDANANITTITNTLDNTKNKSYTYDALNRLSSGTGPWGSISWTYDPAGNRLTQVDITGTSSYGYQAGSNRLISITGANPTSFSYDANGNTLTDNAKAYTYNQNQRLIRAATTQTGDYIYNASGQRVKKTVAETTTVFHYDTGGRLIAETASDGTVQTEYVSIYGQPVAKIDANGTSYIHTDHLGTPAMMTDARGAKVWEIEARPYGDAATISGTSTLNFRFPGQYFDAETGSLYNYFRDYNTNIGRYIEKDPIGLRGGINPFIYVQNNPINWTDPTGLTPGRGNVPPMTLPPSPPSSPSTEDVSGPNPPSSRRCCDHPVFHPNVYWTCVYNNVTSSNEHLDDYLFGGLLIAGGLASSNPVGWVAAGGGAVGLMALSNRIGYVCRQAATYCD
ncbi:MAG TPA: RHS repeat-associated core domain-containing protein [Geobacteraceae bacterium]